MKKLSFLLTLSLLFLFSCSVDEIGTNEQLNTDNSELEVLNKDNTKGIIHHVSAGGNDICAGLGDPNGCDKNYSLVANMRADGTVKGQLIDMWPGDYGGLHVDIECLIVEGNMAKLAGTIKRGRSEDIDLTGWYLVAFLKDNGTSNNETPDQIAFSFISPGTNYCEILEYISFDNPYIEYVDLINGQVKVK